MAFVLWLLMALVPLGLGKGALRILYGNQPTQERNPADEILTGTIVIIGLAEAAHLAGCILGRSFSDCIILFTCLLGVCLLGAGIVLYLGKKRRDADPVLRRRAQQERVKKALSERMQGVPQLIYVVFGILVIVQLVTVVMAGNVYLDGDMTRETVNSFLAENAVYQVNPMTGQAYTLGMPIRLKILCLPTLYAILCQCFGLGVDYVVCSAIPAFVLLLSYLAYSTVAKSLFPENQTGRAVFLTVVALVIGFGDYMPGMDGFGILHSGFRGTTIRAAILIPYTFGLLLRKQYKLVVLCILAEACIVWTLYGMGICVAVTVGMLVISFLRKWYVEHFDGKGNQSGNESQNRKEADKC